MNNLNKTSNGKITECYTDVKKINVNIENNNIMVNKLSKLWPRTETAEPATDLILSLYFRDTE